jgi:hypothetical protein
MCDQKKLKYALLINQSCYSSDMSSPEYALSVTILCKASGIIKEIIPLIELTPMVREIESM